MGDEAPKRHARRRSGDGLEFVGSRRPSMFRQYTDRFQQYTGQVHDVAETDAETNQHHVTVHNNQHMQHQVKEHHQPPVQHQPPHIIHPVKAEPFVAQPINVDESALAEPIAAELETMTIDEEDDELPIVKLKHPSKESDKENRKKRFKTFLILMFTVVCLAVLGVSVLYLTHNQPLFSNSIKKQAGFPLYAPINNASFTANKKSVKIGENDSIVYELYGNATNNHFVISQQKLPEVVKDNTQYQQFLSQINKFADFDSSIGKAYLTIPPNTGNDTTIVVKASTTLLFIRGSGTTSEEEWSTLLSILSVAK